MNKDIKPSEEGISPRNRIFLQMIRDIWVVSETCSTRTYLWGGFAADIFEGRLLRDHGDLDGFVFNMMAIKDRLIIEYRSRGYEVRFDDKFNMLIIEKNGVHGAFNPLDVDGEVAMWRHIGDKGTVYFPYRWLDGAPRRFYDADVYTSGLRFEYGFRKIVPRLNPQWKQRDKDREALHYLSEKIRGEGIDPGSILSRMWSYNPFWTHYGYDPFDEPVLVVPAGK